jgi:hypothetical protein
MNMFDRFALFCFFGAVVDKPDHPDFWPFEFMLGTTCLLAAQILDICRKRKTA